MPPRVQAARTSGRHPVRDAADHPADVSPRLRRPRSLRCDGNRWISRPIPRCPSGQARHTTKHPLRGPQVRNPTRAALRSRARAVCDSFCGPRRGCWKCVRACPMDIEVSGLRSTCCHRSAMIRTCASPWRNIGRMNRRIAYGMPARCARAPAPWRHRGGVHWDARDRETLVTVPPALFHVWVLCMRFVH